MDMNMKAEIQLLNVKIVKKSFLIFHNNKLNGGDDDE